MRDLNSLEGFRSLILVNYRTDNLHNARGHCHDLISFITDKGICKNSGFIWEHFPPQCRPTQKLRLSNVVTWEWKLLENIWPELFEVGDAWWRHQRETFSAWLAFCAGNSPVTGEFPAQTPVTQSFDIFFDLRLNKRLSKQSSGCWSGTLSRSLSRHWSGIYALVMKGTIGSESGMSTVIWTNGY